MGGRGVERGAPRRIPAGTGVERRRILALLGRSTRGREEQERKRDGRKAWPHCGSTGVTSYTTPEKFVTLSTTKLVPAVTPRIFHGFFCGVHGGGWSVKPR